MSSVEISPLNKARKGRPKGSVNLSAYFLQRMLEEGDTPLEILCDNMRFYYDIAKDLQTLREDMGPIKWSSKDPVDLLKCSLLEQEIRFRGLAGDAAVDAAPFVHSKLAQIQHQMQNDQPRKLEVSWKSAEGEKQ